MGRSSRTGSQSSPPSADARAWILVDADGRIAMAGFGGTLPQPSAGRVVVTGVTADPSRQYWDAGSGQVVDKPPQPTPDHEFDWSRKRWTRNRERAAARVRRRRKELLADSDWTQLEDAEMSAEQKTDWREYRRALRRVTTQSGFPEDVQWPEPPSGV